MEGVDTPSCHTDSMSVTKLRGALDELIERADSYCDAESVTAFYRELSRLEAFVTKITAGFDASGDWATAGARNCAAYLATETRLPMRESRRRVRTGRRLREMAQTAEAFEAGEISPAHVEVLCSVRNERTEKHFERDETMLLEQARRLRFSQFARLVSYWEQHADEDGTNDAAEARRTRRDVSLQASYDGMFLGRIILDPVSGAIVHGELDRLERELFEVDWAEAKRRLGRDPMSSELARRPEQRRADALVEMATRSRTAPHDGRRPAPLFSVFVDFETLSGRILELASGIVLTPCDLAPFLRRADLERAVFTPERRVEVGQKSRLFTGATKRAIELRDRCCTHPYCEEPLDRCQVDHILPYSQGGETTQENGRLLCGFHNRLRVTSPARGDPGG